MNQRYHGGFKNMEGRQFWHYLNLHYFAPLGFVVGDNTQYSNSGAGAWVLKRITYAVKIDLKGAAAKYPERIKKAPVLEFYGFMLAHVKGWGGYGSTNPGGSIIGYAKSFHVQGSKEAHAIVGTGFDENMFNEDWLPRRKIPRGKGIGRMMGSKNGRAHVLTPVT